MIYQAFDERFLCMSHLSFYCTALYVLHARIKCILLRDRVKTYIYMHFYVSILLWRGEFQHSFWKYKRSATAPNCIFSLSLGIRIKLWCPYSPTSFVINLQAYLKLCWLFLDVMITRELTWHRSTSSCSFRSWTSLTGSDRISIPIAASLRLDFVPGDTADRTSSDGLEDRWSSWESEVPLISGVF